ncbi:hypothetical protein SK128_023294, partial [Halocaridina rubra]
IANILLSTTQISLEHHSILLNIGLDTNLVAAPLLELFARVSRDWILMFQRKRSTTVCPLEVSSPSCFLHTNLKEGPTLPAETTSSGDHRRSDFIHPCHTICYMLTALCRQMGARVVLSSCLVWTHHPVVGLVTACQTG